MIVDIHSHIKRNPTGQEEEERKLLSDIEKNGIDLRVVSALDGWPVEAGSRYISELVSAYPDRLAGCVVISPKEDNCIETARKALELLGIVMLESSSVEHGYYPDACSGVEDVLAVVEERRVPVKVFIGIGSRSMLQQQLGHVGRHLDLAFLPLHMGCLDYGYGYVDLGKEIPNIYLETSSQYEVQILKKAVTSLPKEKLVFGLSCPERLTRCSLDMFDVFHLDETHREYLFGKSGARMLGLD